MRNFGHRARQANDVAHVMNDHVWRLRLLPAQGQTGLRLEPARPQKCKVGTLESIEKLEEAMGRLR
jgi:hypothetical protein